MWLFDSTLDEIEFNDDGGVGYCSHIDRLCRSDALPAGTYYIKIDELNNNNEIPEYQVSLTTLPCINLNYVYLPLVTTSSTTTSQLDLLPPKED